MFFNVLATFADYAGLGIMRSLGPNRTQDAAYFLGSGYRGSESELHIILPP